MMNKILDYLDYLYPNAKCELKYNKDYELLIAVVLSAQTTDVKVNKVTPILFNKYDSIEKLANAYIKDIENIIREIGTYKKKSKYIIDIAKSIKSNNNIIPNDRNFLENLSGVGRKSANVYLSNIYNVPCIAVDTHVARVSKRLGIVNINDDVSVIEEKLMDFFPKDKWIKLHHQLIFFGRYKCKAIKPDCHDCKLNSKCKKEQIDIKL